MRGRAIGRLQGLGLMACLTACGGSGFEIDYTPEFTGGAMSTSVLGVFRDGHLAEDAWGMFSSDVSVALHRDHCDVGFGVKLRESRKELFETIELEARSNGVNAELLAKIAPAATGETIMTLRMYGNPPGEAKHGRLSYPIRVAHGGGSPAAPRTDASSSPAAKSSRPMEISASLFSRSHRRTVAVLSMKYAGASTDEAIGEFARELGLALPEAFCIGWDWNALPESGDLAEK